jgi:NAD(P)-dependent dehydrogenase (short-subunit alcohol dehydrogenase family)
MFDLSGKTALVTGASSGIGRAIARGLAGAGARVWWHAKSAADFGADAVTDGRMLAADLSRPEEIEALIERFAAQESRLDILVNNAGLERPMPIDSLERGVFDLTMAVNARAPLLLVQGLLPQLKASGKASVINITSLHADVPYRTNIAYCMSKAALAMFTKTAGLELAPLGIRVNALAPGAVATEINREVIDHIGRDKFASWIPAGRVAEVGDIVGPAIFLACDAAAYVTGATLTADGGYGMNLVRY